MHSQDVIDEWITLLSDYLVMKLFFIQFVLFCTASSSYLLLLWFMHFCPLSNLFVKYYNISNFLEEISSLYTSVVFSFSFLLVSGKLSVCIFFVAFRCLYLSLPLFSSQLFENCCSPDNHLLLHFFSIGMVCLVSFNRRKAKQPHLNPAVGGAK